jgi:sensor domain CHASE-containing protein
MFRQNKAWRTGLQAGLLAFICFGSISWCYFQNVSLAKQLAGRDVAQRFALRIVERFYESVGPVYMLASLVRKNNGELSDFDAWATDLIHEFPLLRTLELAPGGVVSHVYPFQGNEVVIGHDLLKDKSRNKEAHLAVLKRQMSVAGPVELMQGGFAAIARYPIFINGQNGRGSFWGFSIALVNMADLLAVAGESEIERSGYDYQLCRNATDSGKCEVFAWRGMPLIENYTTVSVGLPNANWMLTIWPKSDGDLMALKISLLVAVVVASLIVAIGVYFLQRQGQEPTSDDEPIY